jgi:hypothetical protein
MMDVFAVSDAVWSRAPAVVLVLIGLAALCRGLSWAGRSLVRRGGGVVGFLEGFRLVVLGLVLVGLAGAWIWQAPFLFFLALSIGFVEILESSVLIAAMRRDGGRVARAQARRSTAGGA